MRDFLEELRKKVIVGVVGGSDLPKIKEQMGGDYCKKYYISLDFLFCSKHFV